MLWQLHNILWHVLHTLQHTSYRPPCPSFSNPLHVVSRDSWHTPSTLAPHFSIIIITKNITDGSRNPFSSVNTDMALRSSRLLRLILARLFPSQRSCTSSYHHVHDVQTIVFVLNRLVLEDGHSWTNMWRFKITTFKTLGHHHILYI